MSRSQRLANPKAESFFSGVAGFLLAIFLMVVAAAVFTGCVNTAALKANAERNAALNQGHVNDAGLPHIAREIAQDNADAWAMQAWIADGNEPDTAAIKSRTQ